jgi:hypothetical protein
MPCKLCGNPYHYSLSKKFCLRCLELLVTQRAIEQGSLAGKKIERIRPPAGNGPCNLCRSTPCTCRCAICNRELNDCSCSANAILEHYGIFGGSPPASERQPKASGMR